jgi:hypothetical protein
MNIHGGRMRLRAKPHAVFDSTIEFPASSGCSCQPIIVVVIMMNEVVTAGRHDLGVGRRNVVPAGFIPVRRTGDARRVQGSAARLFVGVCPATRPANDGRSCEGSWIAKALVQPPFLGDSGIENLPRNRRYFRFGTMEVIRPRRFLATTPPESPVPFLPHSPILRQARPRRQP